MLSPPAPYGDTAITSVAWPVKSFVSSLRDFMAYDLMSTEALALAKRGARSLMWISRSRPSLPGSGTLKSPSTAAVSPARTFVTVMLDLISRRSAASTFTPDCARASSA
ncbi:hypothetical protein Lesp01_81820 [Lentzea sp. NBRC 102530]|nr:hypothetical protein Lesp01_81820 [Lentzea sp. NBRC 102530]